jgi:hypothetical protein
VRCAFTSDIPAPTAASSSSGGWVTPGAVVTATGATAAAGGWGTGGSAAGGFSPRLVKTSV